MDSRELADYVAKSKKKTVTKAYLRLTREVDFKNCLTVGGKDFIMVVGDKKDIDAVLSDNADAVAESFFEYECANSGVPLAEIFRFKARIEPFAVIREHAEIGDDAVVMHGAVVNIGAKIGKRTMIDMNAVVGSNAIVGEDCHVGAGAVIAGVLEPPDKRPVRIGNGVTIGANAVILEGITVGVGAVVGAGAVVTKDVPPLAVVVGCPAKIVKYADEKTKRKTKIASVLRG